MSFKSSLRNWLSEPEPKREEPPPSLDVILSHYEATLSTLGDDADATALLSVLVQRDHVATMLEKMIPPTKSVQRLVKSDDTLRQVAPQVADADWSAWRRSLNPPPDHWWWRLDETQAKANEKRDLPFVLLAGALMTVALGLAVEIIRRLWGGGPDSLVAVAAVFTLLLTGSPLTKRGRELAEWFLSHIPRLTPRYHGQAMAAMAAIGLVVILAVRFLGLPALTIYYNNRSYDHLNAGELTQARFDFQRAVSLNPDYAAGYYNLAVMYEDVANYARAVELYNKALEYNLGLDLAYNNLGRVYIIQGDYNRAIALLRQGLTVAQDDTTRHVLHTNLGRAYYETKRNKEAMAELQTAIALQSDDAAAHCYLGLIYESLKQLTAAINEWENCLRYVDQTTAEGSEWAAKAKAHLEMLQEGKP